MNQKKQTIMTTILRVGKRRGLILLFALSIILSSAGGMGVPSASGKHSRTVNGTGKHALNQSKEINNDGDDPYSVTIDGVSYPVGGVSATEIGTESVEENAARTSAAGITRKAGISRPTRKNSVRSSGGIDPNDLDTALSSSANMYEKVLKYGESWYGYAQLTDQAEKDLYMAYYNAAVAFAKSGQNYEDYGYAEDIYAGSSVGYVYTIGKISLYDQPMDCVKAYEAYYTFERDNPQFYWMKKRFQSVRSKNGGMVTALYICVDPDYRSVSQRNAVEAQIVQDMKNLFVPAIQNADDEANRKGYNNNQKTYLRIKAIHDVIVNTVDYYHDPTTGKPSSSIEAHSIIGFFKSDLRLVVCEGYAKVFELVTGFYDIPSINVCGNTKLDPNASTGYSGYHAWNMVSFDGGSTYYDIDATWNDSGKSKDKLGPSVYNWYMPAHNIFTKGHFTDTNTDNYKKSGLTIWNNQSGWTFTLPDNKKGIPAKDARGRNINLSMGTEGASYYTWFGADFNDNNVTNYAQARDTLNNYLKKETEKKWLSIVGRKDPMWMAVQLLGFSSYSYHYWDYFGGEGYRRFHFDRPVKSIRFNRDAWDADYVNGEPPDPVSKYVTVTDWKGNVYSENKVQLTNIHWYNNDVTAVANPTNPLSEKPVTPGKYTLIADVELKLGVGKAAGMSIYGGELREVVNINPEGSPVNYVEISKNRDRTAYYKGEVTLTAGLYDENDQALVLGASQYTVTYQWFEISENGDVEQIDGATSNTYTPRNENVGIHWFFAQAYVQASGGAEYIEISNLEDVEVTKRELTSDDLEFTQGSSFSKVYDGTKSCSATVQTKAGVLSTGAVPIAGEAEYNNADFGSTKTITFTPYDWETDNFKIARAAKITTTGGTILARSATVVPDKPVITTITKDSITVQKKDDGNKYQYACVLKDSAVPAVDSNEWKTFTGSDSIQFSELGQNTEYTVYARFVADGSNCETSNASAGTTVKTLSDNTINLLDADVDLERDTFSYTGDEIEPDITHIWVEINGVRTDIWNEYSAEYYWMYYDNVDPGTGYVVVEAYSDSTEYTGVAIGVFTINSYQPTAEPKPAHEGGPGGGGGSSSSGGSSGGDTTPAPTATATALPSAGPGVTEKPASSAAPGGSGDATPTPTPTITPTATSSPTATPEVKVETETDKNGKVIATVTTTIERKPDGAVTTTVDREYPNGDYEKTILEEPVKGSSTIVVEEKTDKTTCSYHYTVMENGNLCFTSFTSGSKQPNIRVPDTVTVSGRTYKVTVVKKGLFSKKKALKKITFGKNVKRIEKKALYKCRNLKRINITSGKLEYIGPKAFDGLAKDAVIRIRAGKKRYKKIVKQIRASGADGIRCVRWTDKKK